MIGSRITGGLGNHTNRPADASRRGLRQPRKLASAKGPPGNRTTGGLGFRPGAGMMGMPHAEDFVDHASRQPQKGLQANTCTGSEERGDVSSGPEQVEVKGKRRKPMPLHFAGDGKVCTSEASGHLATSNDSRCNQKEMGPIHATERNRKRYM